MQRDETLDKLVYELQILRGFAESIQQRIGYVNAAVAELQLATSTLEGISSEESDDTLLMPIGGGSYIRAKLIDREKLVVGIGGDIAMEKTVAEAKEDFKTRILELEKARTSLQQQLEEASARMDGVQRELRKITQQAS